MTKAILTDSDSQRRQDLEALIDNHLNDFIRVLAALAEIKRDRLWRSTHSSYEAFAKEKFNKAKSYGYELAAAGEILANLQESGIPESCLPTSASQFRPLASLEPEAQPEAMSAAVAIAPNQKPTAGHVTRAADAVKSKLQPFEVGESFRVLDLSSPHYGESVKVVKTEGVVVQARLNSGAIAPFLCNELLGAQAAPAQAEVKPKVSHSDGLAGALDVSEARITLLEDLLGRVLVAAKSGRFGAALLREVEQVLS